MSSACKNFRAQHPLGAEIQSVKKVHFGGSICAPNTFLFMDQSSPIFSPNVEGVLVDHGIFRFSACRSVPEIFTSKSKIPKFCMSVAPIFFGGGVPRPRIFGLALQN